MQVLVFNQLRFAPIGCALTSEFHGFYKNTPGRGVHLYKPSGELEAYIVNNPKQGRFVVTASTSHGAPRYMFSTSCLTEKWLNIDGASLLMEDDLISGLRFEEVPFEQVAAA